MKCLSMRKIHMLSLLNLITLHLCFGVAMMAADISDKRQNILLAFPQFESMKLTDKRVLAGIMLAYNNDPWAKNNIRLIQSERAYDIPTVMRNTIADISKYKPALIIGAVNSDIAIGISEVAELKRVPFISPFATRTKVTKDKKFTFTTCFNDELQAESLAKFAVSKGSKIGLALTNQNLSYSVDFTREFTEAFTCFGCKIKNILFQTISDNTIQEISRALTAEIDFILLPSYQTEALNMIQRLSPIIQKPIVFYGGDSWGGGSNFRKVLNHIQKNFIGYYAQHWFLDPQNVASNKFISLINGLILDDDLKGDDVELKIPMAAGYDSALLAFKVLKLNTGTSPEQLSKLILNTQIDGATGTIKYTPPTQAPSKGVFMIRVTPESEKFERYYSKEST